MPMQAQLLALPVHLEGRQVPSWSAPSGPCSISVGSAGAPLSYVRTHRDRSQAKAFTSKAGSSRISHPGRTSASAQSGSDISSPSFGLGGLSRRRYFPRATPREGPLWRSHGRALGRIMGLRGTHRRRECPGHPSKCSRFGDACPRRSGLQRLAETGNSCPLFVGAGMG